jgi:tRNA-(ms[2]io[6]A)-hydroxylase
LNILSKIQSQSLTLEQTLRANTPQAWFDTARERWRELLVDHGNCEKKAASTALSLIFTYADDSDLVERLSRLAREELRHFEQVQRHMRELKVPFMRMSPSRYADGLRKLVRHSEPYRLIDLLVCHAVIEARSCERFNGLIKVLDEPLKAFYTTLAASEARHHQLYLRLASTRAAEEADAWKIALERIAPIEAELATSPDPQFRFHSGCPT